MASNLSLLTVSLFPTDIYILFYACVCAFVPTCQAKTNASSACLLGLLVPSFTQIVTKFGHKGSNIPWYDDSYDRTY